MLSKLFIADLKLLFRNKQSLFWAIAFPLIFATIFGFFFGSGTSGAGTVVVINQSSSTLAQGLVKNLNDQTTFTIKTESNSDSVRDEIKKGTAGAAVIIPEQFGEPTEAAPKNVVILYDPGALQTQAAIEGYLNQYLTQANFQALHATPIYGFDLQKANADSTFTYFDFVLIGLVGMALMNSAIQGLAITMARYRDTQILKRITTTPLKPWVFIAAEVLSRLVLNAVQIALILGIGVKFFSAHITGSVPLLLLISLFGAILFQLLGFFVATMSRNTDTAQSMSQAITVPMMFLSGVFFPIDQLPHWLYSVVKFLPLSPLLRSMRSVALEGGSLANNVSDLTLISVWVIALAIITTYRFKMNAD